MNRFKKILVLVDQIDGINNTLKRAINLAKDNDAEITLVDVFKPIPTPTEIATRYDININEFIIQQSEKELTELVRELKPLHAKINLQILRGINFIEVIKLVHQQQFDLLIKVAAPSGLHRKLFGSLDLHLLRKCPCPVLIDKPSSMEHYSNILSAIDLCSDTNGCDDQVTSLSISLAQREHAQLNFVHAHQLKGERIFREGRFHIPEIELNAMLEHQQSQRIEMMEEWLNQYEYPAYQDKIHILNGDAAHSIHNTAKKINADLIVMGTVGRSGIPGYFIGNTAEELLQTTTCSVLAVKPLGFESPVI